MDQCPALKKRIKPVMSVKRLVYKPTNSFYQVLSAEAYTKHGLNVHAVIFDELHAQPNRELFDVMTKGSGDARTQPLFFLITTAGTDRNSVCFEQHQKALDIIEGRKIDPTFYTVIYGASDEDDWSSEDVWYKANPSLGYTIDIEKVQNAYISAKENAAEENVFRQLRFSVFLWYLTVTGIVLPLSVFLYRPIKGTDDLVLPRKKFKRNSPPPSFSVFQAVYEIDRMVCFCLVKHYPAPPFTSRSSISSFCLSSPLSVEIRLLADGVSPNCSQNLFMIFR